MSVIQSTAHRPTIGAAGASTAEAAGEGRQPRIALFGAVPDTGNLGVSALWRSVMSGLIRRIPGGEISVFDFGRGARTSRIDVDGRSVPFHRFGAINTRRYYSADSLWQIRLSARMGGLLNPAARAILSADAVLDVSAGDSFTDLHGAQRMKAILAPKIMAIEHGIPLVLLPQTYGPFLSLEAQRKAEYVLQHCSLAWARDARSHDTMRRLAGSAFDPRRHRLGVDLAFGLDKRRPAHALPPAVEACLQRRDAPLVGFNISGLIHNRIAKADTGTDVGARRPEDAINRNSYGLNADYRRVVTEIIQRLASETNSIIMLVPHVLSPEGSYESDLDACTNVLGHIRGAGRDRVFVLRDRFDESEVKWIISQCDWFCGTRMHSTIAALSSGVPTAGIAYSLKAQGVFESCGAGDEVADLRIQRTEEIIEHVWQSWSRREASRARLAAALPRVIDETTKQMEQLSRFILSSINERSNCQ